MRDWKDTVRNEIAKGGSEAPCPLCGVPRVRRSDYIRCSGCATNWMDGERLDKHPSIERKEKFLASMIVTAKR